MELYKTGSRGEIVKQIQKALHLTQDGIYGENTAKAVVAFQKKNGIKADGIVGPTTLAALGISSSGIMQAVVVEQTNHTQLRLKRSSRTITEIIVHCTATPEGKDMTVDQIRADHKKKGWSDIGYHYVIYRDGTIHEGRNINVAGAHCTGHNANSIGISYVGGVENRPGVAYEKLKPKDTRTLKQKLALLNLLEALKMIYPKAKIYGHRDFSSKACPSFDARKEYVSII